MNERIAAIVVTHNRRALLAQCLAALQLQTRQLDKIVVVDSASSDGTPEMMSEGGYLRNPTLEYIRLPKNVGGAGGFHEGLKRAYEDGYDWMWLMDDDGCAQTDTLATLVGSKDAQGYLVRAPVLISGADGELSFSYAVAGKRYRYLREIPSVRLLQPVFFFNGVLIHRSVVARAGLPMKELFIYGDEVEFDRRIRRLGIVPVTVRAATFRHPKGLPYRPVLGGLLGSVFQGSELRIYCHYRNQTFIYLRYQGPHSFLYWAAKELTKRLACAETRTAWLMYRAMGDGISRRWGGEQRFL